MRTPKNNVIPRKMRGIIKLVPLFRGAHLVRVYPGDFLILNPNHSLLSNKQNDTILTTAWLHISKDIVSFQMKIMEQMENNIILCNCLRWKRTFCLQSLILCLYAVA